MLLRCTSLEALRVKTLARTGMTTGSAAFTTTHGVINRVHNNTAVAGTTAEPTAATGLAAALQGVLAVANGTDGSFALGENFAGFTGR